MLPVLIRFPALHPQDLAPLLGKDALTLWAKALRSSPYMTAPLFSLMELVPQLLQQPDFSPEACQVLEETVSMVPKETLQVSSVSVLLSRWQSSSSSECTG